MSGRPVHVENLSDVELYEQLLRHGFPAGPVVASTRKVYKRKLSQILGGSRGHVDEQELLRQADEMEEPLTQPVKRVGDFGHTQWSPDSKSGGVRSRTSLSQTYATHSGDVAAGSSSYYTPPREDEMRAHSSLSSSYLGTVRGFGNYDDNIKASASRLSESSFEHRYASPSWKTYGTSGDEAFGKPQYRSTLSGTSPAARQEMASRHRLTGFSDEKASVWNRRNPEKQRNMSLSSKAQFVVFTFLVIVAVAFCYVVYNAWQENDPYLKIEEDVAKFTEEMKDKQE